MSEEIKIAYRRLKVISQDDAKRQEYEARMKALRDYNQGMIEAEKRGQKKLIESMLDSMPMEQIARITKMSVSDIRNILES